MKNKAGLQHSHQHGFGLLDATGMVSAAAIWESVPFSTIYQTEAIRLDAKIPTSGKFITFKHNIHNHTLDGYALQILELVQVCFIMLT